MSSPTTTAALRALRGRGDPLADDAVAALVEQRTHGDLLTLVRASPDPRCRAFVDQTRALPPWARLAAHEAGRRAFLARAPTTFLVLLTGSLVESYAERDGAAVLGTTGRLLKQTRGRVLETASMVRDLLQAGGARPGRRGHEALLRVRLLHARVRMYVAAHPTYDVARRGVPVNQADMLGTLCMFSWVVARGVQTFGGKLNADERASWQALWRCAGHVLGVGDDLLPTDLAEESALYDAVRAGYDPDDVSRALTAATLASLANEPPFHLPQDALHALSRRVIGTDLADALGLSSSRRWAAFARALSVGGRGVDVVVRAPLLDRAAVMAGDRFIEANRRRVLAAMPESDYSFRTA